MMMFIDACYLAGTAAGDWKGGGALLVKPFKLDMATV